MSEKNKKEMVKIVITRPVMGKLAEGEKLQKLHTGDVVTMQRLYADELVSIRKAVLHGTEQHDAFIAREKSKTVAKKPDPKTAKLEADLAAAKQKLAEHADTIADLQGQLAEVTKPSGKK